MRSATRSNWAATASVDRWHSDAMHEYTVAVVHGKALGAHSYSERALQETLDAHAAQGWRLRFIVPERERLLVTFEREI